MCVSVAVGLGSWWLVVLVNVVVRVLCEVEVWVRECVLVVELV